MNKYQIPSDAQFSNIRRKFGFFGSTSINTLYLKICATKKLTSLNFEKKYKIGQDSENNAFFYEHHQHQSKLYIQKCATKKCTLRQFVKSYKKGQGGVDTFLQIHNFAENGCLQIYATKKCPKASLYFLVFFQGGRFQQKEWGQHIFVVGGG